MQHRKTQALERVRIGKGVCGWFFRIYPVEWNVHLESCKNCDSKHGWIFPV